MRDTSRESGPVGRVAAKVVPDRVDRETPAAGNRPGTSRWVPRAPSAGPSGWSKCALAYRGLLLLGLTPLRRRRSNGDERSIVLSHPRHTV